MTDGTENLVPTKCLSLLEDERKRIYSTAGLQPREQALTSDDACAE